MSPSTGGSLGSRSCLRSALVEREPEVEEVAALFSLVEGSEFRGQQLVDLEGRRFGLTREPTAVEAERHPRQPELREVLARVDLDLEPHPDGGRFLRVETIDEVDAALFEVALWRAQPRVEHGADQVERVADGLGFDLDEVDVLRVSGGRMQVELVQGRAAAERQAVGDVGHAEHLDQSAADDEVLLDPGVLAPRRRRPPLGDERARNHTSGSTAMFTATRQRASRGAPLVSFHGARATVKAFRSARTGAR